MTGKRADERESGGRTDYLTGRWIDSVFPFQFGYDSSAKNRNRLGLFEAWAAPGHTDSSPLSNKNSTLPDIAVLLTGYDDCILVIHNQCDVRSVKITKGTTHKGEKFHEASTIVTAKGSRSSSRV